MDAKTLNPKPLNSSGTRKERVERGRKERSCSIGGINGEAVSFSLSKLGGATGYDLPIFLRVPAERERERERGHGGVEI